MQRLLLLTVLCAVLSAALVATTRSWSMHGR
jgi:hypothetical protein